MNRVAVLLVPLVLAGLAAPAAADSPAAPRACVDMVRVPDDVRPVIAEWVAAEPRCAIPLAIRVIRTDGGLYVVATDEAGRTRDRIVPDPLTAAVLIASWVADDGGVGTPTPAPTAAPTPAPSPASTPSPDGIAPTPAPSASGAPGAAPTPEPTPAPGAAPGLAPVALGRETGFRGVRPSMTATPRHRFGAAFQFDDRGYGPRLELDWWRIGWLRLGVASSLLRSPDENPYGYGWVYGSLAGTDVSAMAQAAVELRVGPIGLRTSLSFGAAYTQAHAEWMDTTSSYHSHDLHALSPTGEVTFTSQYWYRNWSLQLGMVITALPGHLESGEVYWVRGIDARGISGVSRAW